MPKFAYTPEIESKLVAAYTAAGKDNKVIPDLAKDLGVTPRSVISKLASLKEYVKDTPAPKRVKDEGPTKKEILAEIEKLDFDVSGLEGATKEALARVKVALSALRTE
jgi:hypothetical protein